MQRKLAFAAGAFQSGQAYSFVAYARRAGLESVASAARNFVTPRYGACCCPAALRQLAAFGGKMPAGFVPFLTSCLAICISLPCSSPPGPPTVAAAGIGEGDLYISVTPPTVLGGPGSESAGTLLSVLQLLLPAAGWLAQTCWHHSQSVSHTRVRPRHAGITNYTLVCVPVGGGAVLTTTGPGVPINGRVRHHLALSATPTPPSMQGCCLPGSQHLRLARALAWLSNLTTPA